LAPTNEKGFTLVEVLIAMVILTVALVSMAELMAVMLRMQMMGRNETAAVRLIQSKVDELVAVSFTGTSAATVAIGGSLIAEVATSQPTPVSSAAGKSRRSARKPRCGSSPS
jgi:prepilin-type N-terminal cleavage/methylation domain-containing protein